MNLKLFDEENGIEFIDEPIRRHWKTFGTVIIQSFQFLMKEG